ncbi:Uncharacterized protein BP5553_08797 [Venustampulla echinocandica]|uniref:Uncharacterized protein n=1 Tax=Venustampulla echinocandica TaxID=2656787 RepID=A0A370TD36_9HELO|nr:Uncharacterized protein BP5553_08797 [Venustampulla echinocandica]RDL32341.1 Uncharacterized protein BP5553_08797 [Venustampulla echinocandica]
MGEHVSDQEDKVDATTGDPLDSVEFTLWDKKPPIKDPNLALFHTTSTPIPPYFWGGRFSSRKGDSVFPTHGGYHEARSLIGDGGNQRLDELTCKAIQYLSDVFGAIDQPEVVASKHLARLRLSNDLQQWREEQHKQNRVLPSKGYGLKPVSKEVCKLLGAEKWPAALVTHGALFGCANMNLFMGAYDAQTLMSNYLNDLGFYYEHGYHKIFPEFEKLIKSSLTDNHALQTPGGAERRVAAEIGIRYIKAKVELEEQHKAKVGNRSAIMDRRTAQIVSLCESSLLTVAGEAVARGYDPAGVMADMVFSCPATDVVDVGCDLHNSEIMNSFLNTADFTDAGIVTEEKLRRVYDAYSHTGARTFVDRWAEPSARMDAQLYKWHILNDRHRFYRLAVLGYSKSRKVATEQREADFDEAFDERLHTTGFSRPLMSACDGGDPCNAVRRLAEQSELSSLVHDVWWYLVTGPMEYVTSGQVDKEREDELVDKLGWMLAFAYSKGLFIELTWLCSHASHHAWQVNYMFEAAMFGSLLDDGALGGKLDRVEA